MTIIIETTGSAAARDYDWLLTAAVDWSHRTDLTSRIPEFIDLAERELFRELSLRNIETSISGQTSGATIDMPDGLSSFERIQIDAGGIEYTLNYTSPNGVEGLTDSTNRPSRYFIQDGVINLLSVPDGPYNYTIFYVPELTSLSESTDTNWLLTNHSDIYLKATLLQIARFTKNMDDVMRLGPEVAAALDSIKRADERKRFPIAGALQIKPRNAR